MAYHNISYRLEPGSLEAVIQKISEIETLLPFLVTLDNSERKGLFKLGPKSTDFVQDAHLAALRFPKVLPSTFDTDEFDKDTTLFEALSQVKLVLDSLTEKVNHTYVAVGSEALTESLEVYAYVQTAADRTPGLKSVADKLKERFKGQGRRRVNGTDDVGGVIEASSK